MTVQNQSSGQESESARPQRRWGRTAVILVLLAAFAGLAGVFATSAMSHGFGFGPGRWHHGGFMGGPMDPAAIEERVDRGIRHLAIEIDATPEQQDRLRTILKAALGDLLPMRDKLHAGRERARDLLTQQTIDRAAIETFRAEQMALVDQASRRISQALSDAAEVLTAEQRGKIDELLPSGGYWHRWHRG